MVRQGLGGLRIRSLTLSPTHTLSTKPTQNSGISQKLYRFDRLNDDDEDDMAVSTGLFSTFISGEMASLAMPFSTSSSSSPWPRLIHSQPPANLRTVRIQTLATASKQATTGRGELRGIMKPRKVSPEMEAIVGAPEISRTQALKLIWAHIKQNNLQDPENKKIIVCDEKLKKIFKGRDRVGFLEVAGLITPHFL